MGLPSFAGLKRWYAYAPASVVCPQPRLLACVGSAPAQRPATALPGRPPSVQSPFARYRLMPSSGSRVSSPQRALPLRHRYYGLMRPSRWLSSPSALASCEESLPVAISPGYPRDLPDVISANLSSDAWSLATAVPPGAPACFFPDVIGLPQQRGGSASRFTREHDYSAERFSTLQTFLNVQASEFARLPDRSYRCTYHLRAAETFTSGHRALRCLRTHRICYPSEYRQLTVRGLSPRKIRSLVGCSPLSTLRLPPRDCLRKTRGQAVRYSFPVRLFHSRLHAGLTRRSTRHPSPHGHCFRAS